MQKFGNGKATVQEGKKVRWYFGSLGEGGNGMGSGGIECGE